jgi:hypothetical protein
MVLMMCTSPYTASLLQMLGTVWDLLFFLLHAHLRHFVFVRADVNFDCHVLPCYFRPEDAYAASKILLSLAGVSVRQHGMSRPLSLTVPMLGDSGGRRSK